MDLDNEQLEALNYNGNCLIIGPPGTGKTEIFNAKALKFNGTSAFLPFTRAARQELYDRLPKVSINCDGKQIDCPNHDITVATIHSFCQSHLPKFPGSYHQQLTEFLKLKNKTKYSLVGIDEVQDLRPLHFQVIKAVVEGTIFAAGDPYQTIFTFGDAIGQHIFPELKKLNCKEFQLHNNYRAGEDIVKLQNYIYPRDIVARGPKTYNRIAIFARTHNKLKDISDLLMQTEIPHILRTQTESNKTVLEESNIHLMVTHACKGLGFDKVYQLDWNHPFDPLQLLQEVNLLYVSVARASQEFFLVEGHEMSFAHRYIGKYCDTISESDLIHQLKQWLTKQ